jgi:type IV pilus assembly protein PilN
MIRVNLLPGKREKAARGAAGAPAGQAWIVGVFGVIILEAVVLFFFHHSMQTKLAASVADNGRLDAQIKKIQNDTADHEEVKAKLAELRDRETAIGKLQGARTGPTTTLLEVSRILTVGRGPTTDHDKLEQLKKDDPGAVPNTSWDPRRLWITKYTELDRTVKIEGLARDGEDVAELDRRLSLSDYFYDVRPPSAVEKIDETSHISLKQFTIVAKVRY